MTKTMRALLGTALIILGSQVSVALPAIEKVDQMLYRPAGLQDLAVAIDIDDSGKKISRHPALAGKAPVVDFLWRKDGRLASRAAGIPDGNPELYAFGQQIRSLVEVNGRYVFHDHLMSNYTGWSFQTRRDKSLTIVTVTHPQRKVPPHIMVLDGNDRLVRLTVDSGSGNFVTHDYTYQTLDGKLAVSGVKTVIHENRRPVQTTDTEIKRQLVSGFQLPQQVIHKTRHASGVQRTEVIRFSNYRLNTGLTDEQFL